jgi:hypothetical protein
MTIEQTIEVPASHRITLDVPREIPAGRANIIIQFRTPADMQSEKTAAKAAALDRLTGCLAGVGDIDLEEIREERLAKYLK